MDVQVEHRPSYALAKVKLGPGEAVRAEGGAMVAMTGDVQLQTRAEGGILKSLARKVLAGESFFQNTYTAGPQGGDVLLAPAYPGDVHLLHLQGEALIVQDGSYLASAPSVSLDTSWQGAKSFFAGESFVMLRVAGHGPLLMSSYGAIERRDLAAGERFAVDTGHVVAFREGMQYRTRAVGNLKSSLFSGEGIVSEFTGPGTLWLQTRSIQAFLAFLAPYLPKQGGGSSGSGGGLFG
jgi:uncharacterized protein (TIGR00266 family)